MNDERVRPPQPEKFRWRPSVRAQIWIIAGVFFAINAVLLAAWAIALALNIG